MVRTGTGAQCRISLFSHQGGGAVTAGPLPRPFHPFFSLPHAVKCGESIFFEVVKYTANVGKKSSDVSED